MPHAKAGADSLPLFDDSDVGRDVLIVHELDARLDTTPPPQAYDAGDHGRDQGGTRAAEPSSNEQEKAI